jgi:predicted membrane-bound spermidine synthase
MTRKPAASSPVPAADGVPAAPELSPALRRYLYLTACVTGAAVMIVEILGAKMLAPYFGTSHFVWTAQIAVTMAALACGYYAGGRLVDRAARLGRLYAAILAAALALTLTVLLRERVAYALLGLPLAAGSLLASVFLFFVPLGLLAMTGPFLARVVTRSLRDIGGTVGRLSALSTVGSLVGTAAIGYLLIPLLPNSWTMYGTAAVLAAMAAGWFLAWGRRSRTVAAAAACIAVGIGAGAWGLRFDGPRIPGNQELYRRNSSFGLIQVIQPSQSRLRFYLTDYLTQNVYDPASGTSAAMFTWMLEGLARSYAPRLDDVLCIGMGVGIVPRDLARSGSRVDVVEINPAVVPVARRFFDLDPEAFDLTIGDGRWFVNQSAARYDAVLLDAFVGDGAPSHLMSREAFAAIARVLKPDGVLVINTFVDFGSRDDFLGASLMKTLRTVFAGVRAHGKRDSNMLFVASQRDPLTPLSLPDFGAVHPDALADVRTAFTSLWEPDPAAGIVLTDDFNPAEFHDAANREKLRRRLALSMRTRS